MKPLQIGLLVLVGALGGAVIMRVTQRPQATTAALSRPAASPPAPVVPVAEPVTAHETREQPKPAPFPHPVSRPKPVRVVMPVRMARPAVVTATAQNRPPPPAITPPVPAPPDEPPAQPAEPAPAPAPDPEPPPLEAAPTVTLRAGMLLPVRLGEKLSSDSNQSGDTFTATLDTPLVADGFVIAERGARLEGRVVEAGKPGAVRGTAALGIELTRLHTSDGQRVTIQTETFRKQASGLTGEDIGKVAAAAGLGAAIGAIAGGGKGAGIGAAVGGVAGAGGVAVTRHSAAQLASETKISFRLREAVTITERLNPDGM